MRAEREQLRLAASTSSPQPTAHQNPLEVAGQNPRLEQSQPPAASQHEKLGDTSRESDTAIVEHKVSQNEKEVVDVVGQAQAPVIQYVYQPVVVEKPVYVPVEKPVYVQVPFPVQVPVEVQVPVYTQLAPPASTVLNTPAQFNGIPQGTSSSFGQAQYNQHLEPNVSQSFGSFGSSGSTSSNGLSLGFFNTSAEPEPMDIDDESSEMDIDTQTDASFGCSTTSNQLDHELDNAFDAILAQHSKNKSVRFDQQPAASTSGFGKPSHTSFAAGKTPFNGPQQYSRQSAPFSNAGYTGNMASSANQHIRSSIDDGFDAILASRPNRNRPRSQVDAQYGQQSSSARGGAHNNIARLGDDGYDADCSSDERRFADFKHSRRVSVPQPRQQPQYAPQVTNTSQLLNPRGKPTNQLCRFFRQGRCNKGNGCRFSHQDPMTLQTSAPDGNFTATHKPVNIPRRSTGQAAKGQGYANHFSACASIDHNAPTALDSVFVPAQQWTAQPSHAAYAPAPSTVPAYNPREYFLPPLYKEGKCTPRPQLYHASTPWPRSWAVPL
jgi:hypothetical protein